MERKKFTLKSPVVKGRPDWIPETDEKMVVLSFQGMSE